MSVSTTVQKLAEIIKCWRCLKCSTFTHSLCFFSSPTLPSLAGEMYWSESDTYSEFNKSVGHISFSFWLSKCMQCESFFPPTFFLLHVMGFVLRRRNGREKNTLSLLLLLSNVNIFDIETVQTAHQLITNLTLRRYCSATSGGQTMKKKKTCETVSRKLCLISRNSTRIAQFSCRVDCHRLFWMTARCTYT